MWRIRKNIEWERIRDGIKGMLGNEEKDLRLDMGKKIMIKEVRRGKNSIGVERENGIWIELKLRVGGEEGVEIDIRKFRCIEKEREKRMMKGKVKEMGKWWMIGWGIRKGMKRVIRMDSGIEDGDGRRC